MSPQEMAARRREIRRQNRLFTDEFQDIPEHKWPKMPAERGVRYAVKRNRSYLVQIFVEPPGHRLTINRTEIGKDGKWVDGITWDELFWVKNKVGFSNFDAVEIFPRECDLVYVANMRHLWVILTTLPYGWRKQP